MFARRRFVLFLVTINSGAFAAIHDETFISQHGPFGLMLFEKNDTFVDWVRVPEENYNQWIFALRFWRTCSIVSGLLCLVFAVLVLIYIIQGFRTNSTGPFSCLGDEIADEGMTLSNSDLPTNLQQLALQHQLRLAQQQEQDALRQKYEAERRLSAMLRNPIPSAVPLKTQLK